MSPPALVSVDNTDNYYMPKHRRMDVNNLKVINVQPKKTSSPDVEIKQIKFGLLNVRSLNNKSFLVNDLITENKLDCICLVETWLNNDTATAIMIETCPPDYSFHQLPRRNRRGGGVAVVFSPFHNLCLESQN